MGISALVGGISHGFFESEGKTPAWWALDKAKDLATGAIAFFVLLAAGRQFFGPRAQTIILVIALVQLGAFAAAVFLLDSFLVVIANYAPAVLLLLVLSVLGLSEGTVWQMVVGLALSVAASLLQALGVDTFSPLDRNGRTTSSAWPRRFSCSSADCGCRAAEGGNDRKRAGEKVSRPNVGGAQCEKPGRVRCHGAG